MENIFGNRRRYWQKADFWNSSDTLSKAVDNVYSRLNEPIIGNKVVITDIWGSDDVVRFCNLFRKFKIIFMIRDPKAVALSRLKREPSDFFEIYNKEARENILLDFRSRFHAYISSWRQSVENYWRLKDGLMDNIKLVYYEDFCENFENQIREIFSFLEINFSEKVLRWFELPHHNKDGELVKDLKYPDIEVFSNNYANNVPNELNEVIKSVKWQYDLWEKREL